MNEELQILIHGFLKLNDADRVTFIDLVQTSKDDPYAFERRLIAESRKDVSLGSEFPPISKAS